MEYELDQELKINARQFASREFTVANRAMVDDYIALRVRGVHAVTALTRIFGHQQAGDAFTQSRINALEGTPYYIDAFERRLKEMPLDELLSARRALHFYLEMSGDPYAKEAARNAAMKEACVLAGIVTIDEKGNTQAKRPTLEDFYKSNRQDGPDQYALQPQDIPGLAEFLAANPEETKH